MHIIFQLWEDLLNVKKNSHVDNSVVINATIKDHKPVISHSGPKSGKMLRVVLGRES